MPKNALGLILDESNDVFVSCASAWEVSIKHKKNPAAMAKTGNEFLRTCASAGFGLLGIGSSDIAAYDSLATEKAESVHRDPFDRMLIAQAKAHNMMLITHDKNLALYDEPLVSIV